MKSIAKNLLLVLFAAAWIWTGQAPALAAGAKVALVIGNGSYRQQEPLATAARDAGAVAAALRALDFEVIEESNLNNGGFRAALNTFSERLQRGDLALLYFMGHAVQVNGRNFLLPIGARLRREFDLLTQGVASDAIRHLMTSSGAEYSVILLDASYPNRLVAEQPWAEPGLAEPRQTGSDTLFAYAAEPGSESPLPDDQGSAFARGLVEALERPDPELVSALRALAAGLADSSGGSQRPWVDPQFTATLPLESGGATPEQVASPEPATSDEIPRDDVEGEIVKMGETAEETDATPQATEQQSEAPTEVAAGAEATTKPESADQPKVPEPEQTAAVAPAGQPESEPEPEPDPNAFDTALSPAARGQIQRDLRALGFYRGGIDRQFGSGTRRGIRKLQSELGEEATGYLTEAQTEALAGRAATRRKALLEQQRAEHKQAEQEQQEKERKEREAAQRKAEAEAKKKSQAAAKTTRKLSEVERLTQQAEKGDAKAQSALGVRYFHGRGVAKDYEKARFWYLKAAKAGEATAQTNLGFLYFNGYGVQRSLAEAAKWLRAAAEQGQPEAQFNLGILYENGSGVAKSYPEAAKWYEAAAKRGMAEAGQRLKALKSRNLVQ